MIHKIKIKQCYLYHILEDRKTFEIRKNDRDYQVGDIIQFMPLEDNDYDVYEWMSPLPDFEITYVHSGFGLEPGYVALSIKMIGG